MYLYAYVPVKISDNYISFIYSDSGVSHTDLIQSELTNIIAVVTWKH